MAQNKIHFQVAGQRLDGTLMVPDGTSQKCPGVIFFHGMTSSEKNYLEFAEPLVSGGIAVMTVSFRGHGTSDGDFDSLAVNDAVEDGLVAYDFFTKQQFIDQEQIGLCGSSLGAAVAMIVSAQRKVRSLLLRVSAAYTEKMMKLTYREIMAEEEEIFRDIKDASATPALKAAQLFKGSLLVVTSENDVVIPQIIPDQYFSQARLSAKKELIEMKEATHGLSKEEWRKEFAQMTTKWFRETLA